MNVLKIGIISGYFNPVHRGHLELIEMSKRVVDCLAVIVNSDLQRVLKGSKEFMSEGERLYIISKIKGVDKAYLSVDEDRSVCKSIGVVVDDLRELYEGLDLEFYFINGGDRLNSEIPESVVCDQLGVKILDGFGDKVQSSSWLLDR
jgi:D-beta-D-heptose 7-phosphate kinase/D-beta-D-heptose 1-phosphate adenosyltransferase